MTKDDLRRLALVLPGAEEKLHFNKADFRVKNKIFVSLKDDATGVIKLSPEQQAMMVEAEPRVFQPIPGGWGAVKAGQKSSLRTQTRSRSRAPCKRRGKMSRRYRCGFSG